MHPPPFSDFSRQVLDKWEYVDEMKFTLVLQLMSLPETVTGMLEESVTVVRNL